VIGSHVFSVLICIVTPRYDKNFLSLRLELEERGKRSEFYHIRNQQPTYNFSYKRKEIFDLSRRIGTKEEYHSSQRTLEPKISQNLEKADDTHSRIG